MEVVRGAVAVGELLVFDARVMRRNKGYGFLVAASKSSCDFVVEANGILVVNFAIGSEG